MSSKKNMRHQSLRSRRKASAAARRGKRRAKKKRRKEGVWQVQGIAAAAVGATERCGSESIALIESAVSSSAKRRSRARRRIVKAGDYVLASPRVVSRHCLFRPDAKMREALAYVVALAAEKFGIEVYACVLMSTHLHILYRDVRGNRPKFHKKLHRDLALFTKAHRGWSGQVFAKNHSQVRLHGHKAVIDKIGYLVANPVAAGAVRYAQDWPGFITRIDDMGKIEIGGKRPDAYFGKRKTAPDEAYIELRLPPIVLAHYDGDENAVREALKSSRDGHAAKARSEMKAKSWSFMGAARCQKKNPFDRAKAYEVFDTLNPQFAFVGLSGAERQAVFDEYARFMSDYDRCREALLRLEEGIIWPSGTWKMVHELNHAVAP